MEIEVGDIVKLKPIEQLMRDGWYLSNTSKEGWKHKDSSLRVSKEMIEGKCLNKEAEVGEVVNSNHFYAKGESCLYDKLMVEYVIPVEKPTLKVGDKVRLKSLDEITKLEGFYMNTDEDIISFEGSDYVELYGSEIECCGEIFTILKEEDGRFHLRNKDSFLVRVSPKIFDFIYEPIEEPTNPNLVNLEQATIALINGECDAIRYHTNNSICAYRDKDTGVFKVAKYRGENSLMYYTNKLFFMHEGYILDSKWELIVDNVKREQIKRHKKHLIATLDSLFLLNGIDEETYEMFMNKAEVI